MNIEKINVNGTINDIKDVEDVAAEIARAQAAEQLLQNNIDAEKSRAEGAEAQLGNAVAIEVARAQTAEGNLREGTTARFARIVESANISTGEPDFFKEVVYIKSANKFAAADNGNAYWDTWNGMDEYMNGNEVRKDKVYLCGDATYVFHNGALRDRVAELIGEAPDTLDSIHEIADWINNDKTGAAAMATQISENRAAITTEAQRATGVEAQLQSKIDADVAAEATRALAAEKELNARKADEDGYHPKMTTGFSDNLVGRGEAVESQFNYRPSGGAQSIEDGVARIERIKGNSIAWNQLAKAQTGTYINGVTIESVGDGSYKVYSDVDTPSTADVLFPVTDALVYGRKVVFFGSSDVALCTLKAEKSAVQDNGNGGIISSTATGERVCIYVPAGTTINTAITIHPQVFDLTQMFGTGREPSLDEFKALYPYVYDYNAGEMRFLNASAIKSVGFNLLNLVRSAGTLAETDFEKETKRPSLFDESIYIVGLAAQNYFNAGQISSYRVINNQIEINGNAGYGIGFPIKVLPNTSYYFNFNRKYSNGIVYFLQYDSDGALISYRGYYSTFLETTKSNAAFGVVLFVDESESGEVFTNINLNLAHTGYRNGEEEKYKAFSRELPIKEYFPNGMMSAGNAYDEMTKDKAVKRIGVVDLGKCKWYRVPHTSDELRYQYWTSDIPNCAPGGNLISKLYIAANNILEVADNPNGAAAYITDQYALHVTHFDYNTLSASEFKTAMSGVMFYYELANPEETIFPDPLNLDYEVSDFGTEEAVSEGNSAPFRADIVYGFNAVDTIRNNRTSIQELLARIEALESKVS